MNDFTERKLELIKKNYWDIQVPSEELVVQARHLAVIGRLEWLMETTINELVGEIKGKLPEDIPDPCNAEASGYQDCLDELRTLLDSYKS